MPSREQRRAHGNAAPDTSLCPQVANERIAGCEIGLVRGESPNRSRFPSTRRSYQEFAESARAVVDTYEYSRSPFSVSGFREFALVDVSIDVEFLRLDTRLQRDLQLLPLVCKRGAVVLKRPAGTTVRRRAGIGNALGGICSPGPIHRLPAR
jgi:hypothetical protein